MASTQHLYSDAYFVSRHIIRKYLCFENREKDGYFAAVIIQRLWRGYATRKIVKNWHRAATVIQKHVRGWLVRWHLPDFYREYLEWRKKNYYDRMATKIQALWRGFYVRKYVRSQDEIWKQRKRVEQENAMMKEAIGEAFQNLEKRTKESKEVEAKEWVIYILYKLHHLLRTTQREGIYSLKGETRLSYLETLIKSIQYTPYMKELRKAYQEIYEEHRKLRPYCFEGRKAQAMEECYKRRGESNEIKKGVNRDNTPNNTFKLTPKIEKSAYQRLLMTQEDYAPMITNVTRTTNRSRFLDGKGFDLHVLKKADIQEKKPHPYYLDLWEKRCYKHEIRDDVICTGNKK